MRAVSVEWGLAEMSTAGGQVQPVTAIMVVSCGCKSQVRTWKKRSHFLTPCLSANPVLLLLMEDRSTSLPGWHHQSHQELLRNPQAAGTLWDFWEEGFPAQSLASPQG